MPVPPPPPVLWRGEDSENVPSLNGKRRSKKVTCLELKMPYIGVEHSRHLRDVRDDVIGECCILHTHLVRVGFASLLDHVDEVARVAFIGDLVLGVLQGVTQVGHLGQNGHCLLCCSTRWNTLSQVREVLLVGGFELQLIDPSSKAARNIVESPLAIVGVVGRDVGYKGSYFDLPDDYSP